MKNIFFSLVLASTISATSYADKIYLLASNTEAMQARIDIIQQAEKELLVEYFSIWNDEQSLAGIGLLIEAAKRGVKVKVIYDSLSTKVPKSLLAGMVNQGVDAQGNKNIELRAYNPLNLKTIQKRTHVKMILADGKRAISGGRNVGDKYFGKSGHRNYDDLDIMVESKELANTRENFLALWETGIVTPPNYYSFDIEKLTEGYCGTREHYDVCEQERRTALNTIKTELSRVEKVMTEIATVQHDDEVINLSGKDWMKEGINVSKIEFLSNKPEVLNDKSQRHMAERLLEVLANTKNSINIVTPYLIPTAKLLVGLQAALDRGVKVSVLTNSLLSTDNFFAQAGYRKYRMQLIEMGVEIHEYVGPDTMHAKAGLIDDHISIVGTFNLDPRSSNLNRELAFMITEDIDNAMAAKSLKHHMQHFKQKSRVVGKDKQAFIIANEEDKLKAWQKILLKVGTIALPFIEKYL